jgi:hypothetical protein
MARGVGQRHHAAEGCAEHDRRGDAERIAKCAHVVAPLRQMPAFPWPILASAIAAMIEVDDLRDIGQGGVGGLVDRMVEAGTAMKQEQGRPLAHGGAFGHKLRALDIEEQPDAVHGHVHVPVSLMNGSYDQGACLFRRRN